MSLRSAIKGIDYFRAREYEILFSHIGDPEKWKDKNLLDLACGEEVLPFLLSKRIGERVYAIDFDYEKVSLQKRFTRKIFKHEFQVFLAQMDGTCSGFRENSFDMIVNLAMISLLEGDNDILLMKEISRILKPKGILFISVGFSVQRNLKERKNDDFFFRRYDQNLLRKRIITSSGLVEIGRTYFGEKKINFSAMWYALPFILRLPFRWATPFFSWIFCHELNDLDIRYAQGIFLALQKI